IGILRNDFTVLNVSPNLGYNVTKNISFGLGLSLQHTGDKNALVVTAIDYKIFGRYEFLKNRCFVQSEYITLIPGMSYLKVKEGDYDFNDTVLLGGGMSLHLKGKKALSFAILYNLNDNIGTPAYESKVITRLGIKLF